VTVETVSASQLEHRPRRAIEVDGAALDIFDLPTDEETLKDLFCDLFEKHWREIVFGPIIQGAAYEFHPPSPPTYFGTLDGYLTIAFGVSHFHLCIGAHKGAAPELARHRRTARAELYRRLDRKGAPISWGLRLFNGEGEQQITVLLPNPFLDPATDKLRKTPDWAQLALWESLRQRWLGLGEPDPIDRSGHRFHHD
jgi:hypothetical protein